MKKFISIAIALMIIMISAVPAFAVQSPQATVKYHVVVVPSGGGDGSYEFTTDIDEKGDQHVIIKPKPDDGYELKDWDITGDYTIVKRYPDGSIEIIIRGDIKCTPHYVKKTPGATNVEEPTKAVVSDTSKTSPQTGNNNVAVVVTFLLALSAVAVVSTKVVKAKKK